MNTKENSKLKSDIFESNELNDSLNNNENINLNIGDISSEKYIDSFIIKENNNKSNNNTNNNSKDLNEICNYFNDEINNSNINYDINKLYLNNKNKNNKEQIKNIKNNNNLKFIKKNILFHNFLNENQHKDSLKKDLLNNNLSFDNKIFFDSLENNKLKKDKNYFYLINKNKKDNNRNNNIRKNKIKILNEFLNNNSIIENNIKKNNKYDSKKYSFQISETNNIFLNSKNKNDINLKENSFTCTNQSKVDNIFIKGEKKIKNKILNSSKNKYKKNLELFKNNDDKISNENSIKNDLNIFINKNIDERLIDSKMIINFLNNSKNEPMFPSNIFSTNQTSKSKLEINETYSNDDISEIKIDEKNKYNKNYSDMNNNFNLFKNFIYNEEKNDNHLKKQIRKAEYENNIINISNYTDNLEIKEGDLIEPNIQICPISKSEINENSHKKNNLYEKIHHESVIKDSLTIQKMKKIHKKLIKNLSYDILDNSKIKYNHKIKNDNKLYMKDDFISYDLNNFINNLKENKEKKGNYSTEEVYNYNAIKYDKYNIFRENSKNNSINKKIKNNSIINSKRKNNNIIKIFDNKKIINNIKNKYTLENNKKGKADYKTINELYSDFKIQDKKRKKQDIKSTITFIPHKNKNKKYN